MIKILSTIILLNLSLFGQNFDAFLKEAIKNSTYLKSSDLSISQAKQQGDILTRYENPSLELEYSNFSPQGGDADSGYRLSYTQPLRLWGVGNDKIKLSDAIIKSANMQKTLNLAEFTRTTSLLYSIYAHDKKYLLLSNEQLNIAKRIYEISKERYKAGTISRGELLQSSIDYKMIEIKIQEAKLKANESYFSLLEYTKSTKEVEIDFTHSFSKIQMKNINNPELLYLKKQKNKSLANAKVNSNKLEFINIVGEYEKEPEQNIFRLGASIPLVIFNTKSQEKRIAKLQSDKFDLQAQNKSQRLKIELSKLTKKENLLLLLKTQNQNTLKLQLEVLKMFEQGYKIANVNLLELQYIQNKLIKTKENLINIESSLNENAIWHNYITGVYND
ncbi:TolC family protein [Sulfurimonas sp.]|uniref:TolC family protein n=1 Tax=Sulfurimonas sp. TaxID=2022749 RepID=UPI002AB2888D|nr:TolC family protein [Sulfurimonas sp.]